MDAKCLCRIALTRFVLVRSRMSKWAIQLEPAKDTTLKGTLAQEARKVYDISNISKSHDDNQQVDSPPIFKWPMITCREPKAALLELILLT